MSLERADRVCGAAALSAAALSEAGAAGFACPTVVGVADESVPVGELVAGGRRGTRTGAAPAPSRHRCRPDGCSVRVRPRAARPPSQRAGQPGRSARWHQRAAEGSCSAAAVRERPEWRGERPQQVAGRESPASRRREAPGSRRWAGRWATAPGTPRPGGAVERPFVGRPPLPRPPIRQPPRRRCRPRRRRIRPPRSWPRPRLRQ